MGEHTKKAADEAAFLFGRAGFAVSSGLCITQTM